MYKKKIYEVTTLSDKNYPGTLRYFLYKSQKNKYTEIIFKVSGVIKLCSSLPKITQKVVLDGTQIPNFNAVPLIEIDCNCYEGLIYTNCSAGSIIKGISITNSITNGISIYTDNILIYNNYIGIGINNKNKGNNRNGIFISTPSKNNIIGQNNENKSDPSNIISGNKQNGIKLYKTSGNTIISNFIGTDLTGTLSISNHMNGIELKYSNNNIIGGKVYTNSDNITNNPTGNKGTVPIVHIFPPLGNLISGNNNNGVYINKCSNSNILNGNFIGTNISGLSKLGNKHNGVLIKSSNKNKMQGCTLVENPFVYYNVCSGNYKNGIQISKSKRTVIQGNFCGIGANNAVIVTNGENGILVDKSSSNTIIGGPIPLGNVCSGNTNNGIKFTDKSRSSISYNTFSGLYAFGKAAPNSHNGILINGDSKNNIVRTCVCSGNKENGIKIAENASKITLESIICGANTDGNTLLSNGKNGVLLCDNTNNNIIGKNVISVIPRSVLSGNNENGICITDNAYKNIIKLEFVGLDISGKNTGLGNNKNGLLIDKNANNNYIGSEIINDTILTNYFSANKEYGIQLAGNSYKNIIDSNIVGLDIIKSLAINTLGSIIDISKCKANIIKNNITN